MKEFLLTFSKADNTPVIEAGDPIEAETLTQGERVVGYCKDGPRVLESILAHHKILLMHADNYYWEMTLEKVDGKPLVSVTKGHARATYAATTYLGR